MFGIYVTDVLDFVWGNVDVALKLSKKGKNMEVFLLGGF